MPAFNHLRLNLFALQRYSPSESREMYTLHQLYQRYLQEFRDVQDTPLALLTPGDVTCPLHKVILPISADRRVLIDTSQSLRGFSEAILNLTNTYQNHRFKRWLYSGYPNDPTNLLCQLLRNVMQDFFMVAACNEDTLRYLIAIRDFFSQIRLDKVFCNEPSGHISIDILLHNLVRTLNKMLAHVEYEIRLDGARKHFSTVKNKANAILDYGVGYLFYVLSGVRKSHLEFSIIGHHTMIDKNLKQALETREGALLRNLVNDKRLSSALMRDKEKEDLVTPYCGGSVPLLIPDLSDDFFDPNQKINPDILKILQGEKNIIRPEYRKMSLGICSIFTHKIDILSLFIKLHGLIISFAEYNQYLEEFWKLSGFGGNYLIYGKLANTVRYIMSEFLDFNAGFEECFTTFSQLLEVEFDTLVTTNQHHFWKENYLKSQNILRSLLEVIASCNISVRTIIEKTEDTPQQYQSLKEYKGSYEKIIGAEAFINKVRGQLGKKAKNFSLEKAVPFEHLLVLPEYAQVELTSPEETNSIPINQIDSEPMTIEEALLYLIGDQVQYTDELSLLCNNTPKLVSWCPRRGTNTRVAYLEDLSPLFNIAKGLHAIQSSPLPGRNNASVHFQHLGTLLETVKSERARLIRYKRRLSSFFHKKSIRFFTLWDHHFASAELLLMRRKEEIERAIIDIPQDTPFSDTNMDVDEDDSSEKQPFVLPFNRLAFSETMKIIYKSISDQNEELFFEGDFDAFANTMQTLYETIILDSPFHDYQLNTLLEKKSS